MVDASGKDLTEILTPERLVSIAQTIPKRTAQDIAKHARKPIEVMTQHAEAVLAGALEEVIADAVDRADTLMGQEISRLKSLASLNGQVRDFSLDIS